MLKLFVLAVSLLLWIPAILCMVTTSSERTVLEGQSVTVPCHYEPQYAGYVKYWCQGRTRESCTSLSRTDDTPSDNPAEEKVSTSDDPVQQVFTVTMNNLKEADAGWYMCGVEIGGVWSRDVVTSTYITVIHGLSVVQNQVIGEEGGGVTVECFYSERLRQNEKKWCRIGDWSSCRLTGPEGSYEDTSLAISDDRTRTLTITLKKLQLEDIGWYWCSAGQQQIAVQVLVTPRPTMVSVATPLTSSLSDAHHPPLEHIRLSNSHWSIDQPSLVCSSLLVLLAMAILGIFMWRIHKRQHPSPEQDLVWTKVPEEEARMNKSLDVNDLKVAHMY